MRAAVYVRVSTDEQAMEGYSLDAQASILNDYCVTENWDVTKVYCDDGYSGTNIKRPAYEKMMNEADDWDVLLVLKIDRIHRNSRNFMNMMDELNSMGKKFVSCMESLDTTNALGRFVVDMIQRLAQLESEQIGERTYMGMREKAETMRNTEEENQTLGFNAPYGYHLEGGYLYSVDNELEIVGDVFELYIDGMTMDQISHHLNSSKMLTRRGNPWTKYSIGKMLHNPIYAGYMRWDGVLIRHFGSTAVEPELYNAVQKIAVEKVRDPEKRRLELIPGDSS